MVTSPVLFFPHMNQTWGYQKSLHLNQILQDDIKVCFQNGIPWTAKRGTSATSRYNNSQSQVLFQIVFLPYIARCGYTEEERLGIQFEELDKMWLVAQELVIFKWRCISLLCVWHTYSTCLKADCEFHDTDIPLAILLREELLISGNNLKLCFGEISSKKLLENMIWTYWKLWKHLWKTGLRSYSTRNKNWCEQSLGFRIWTLVKISLSCCRISLGTSLRTKDHLWN